MEYVPSMKSTEDKIKLIAAIIVLALSTLFNREFESDNQELITAIAVLIAYVIGLYSDVSGRGDKKDE